MKRVFIVQFIQLIYNYTHDQYVLCTRFVGIVANRSLQSWLHIMICDLLLANATSQPQFFVSDRTANVHYFHFIIIQEKKNDDDIFILRGLVFIWISCIYGIGKAKIWCTLCWRLMTNWNIFVTDRMFRLYIWRSRFSKITDLKYLEKYDGFYWVSHKILWIYCLRMSCVNNICEEMWTLNNGRVYLQYFIDTNFSIFIIFILQITKRIPWSMHKLWKF